MNHRFAHVPLVLALAVASLSACIPIGFRASTQSVSLERIGSALVPASETSR